MDNHTSLAHPAHWTDNLNDIDRLLMSYDPSAVGEHNISALFAANETESEFTYKCSSLEMTVVHRVVMAFYAFVFVGGFLGNAMIIYTVLRCSGMQTVTNRYILNLAIADECFLVGMPFLIATMNVGDWVFGKWMCKAYMVSTSITQFTSSLFLLIMSADRYVAICHHISSPKYRTANVSRALSVLAWLSSAMLIGPIIRYTDVLDKGGERYTCAVVWPDDRAIYGLSFTLYTFVFAFLLPLCFILLFYGAVLLKLKRVSRRTQMHQQTNLPPSANANASTAVAPRPSRGATRHRKVTRLVLCVITVYVCCWSPYWIGQLALILAADHECSTRLELIAFLVTSCLGYLNSAINPVLYAYLSETFRKSLLKTVTCLRWCSKSSEPAGGASAGAGGAALANAQKGQLLGGAKARGAPNGTVTRSDYATEASSRAALLQTSRDGRGKRGSDTLVTMATRSCTMDANTTTSTGGLSSRQPSPLSTVRNGLNGLDGGKHRCTDNGKDNELLPLSTAA